MRKQGQVSETVYPTVALLKKTCYQGTGSFYKERGVSIQRGLCQLMTRNLSCYFTEGSVTANLSTERLGTSTLRDFLSAYIIYNWDFKYCFSSFSFLRKS